MNIENEAKTSHLTKSYVAETPWLDPDAVPFIQIKGLSKQFGDFSAVDCVDLDIYKGELFTILGGSGCGKSTLLRMLAGFETPSNGQIIIDGVDMSNIPAYDRPVNMMFQSYALFPHMTVEKNIAFGLKQDNLPENEIRKRVEEMLELVELTDFAKRKPNQLSGGQSQRVALARSLAKRPKLLLLDEPLGALDKRLREQTQFELLDIQEKLEVTFVIVTHDQEEAMTVSSRIGVMDSGNLIQVATPTEIYEAPVNKDVADFIGDVNILRGIYKGQNDVGTQLHSDDSDSIVFATQEVGAATGDEMWFAIRPEKLEISKKKPTDQHNILNGRIEDIAYGGSFSTYHVRLDNGRILKAIRANRVRTEEHHLTWEDEVYLHWSPDSAVVLLS